MCESLRMRLFRDKALVSETLLAFVRVVTAYHRRRARERGVAGGETGAVTAIQLAGSFANANLHFHTVIPEGVWHEQPNGTVAFHALPPPPTDEDIAVLTVRIVRRVARLLARRDDLAGHRRPYLVPPARHADPGPQKPYDPLSRRVVLCPSMARTHRAHAPSDRGARLAADLDDPRSPPGLGLSPAPGFRRTRHPLPAVWRSPPRARVGHPPRRHRPHPRPPRPRFGRSPDRSGAGPTRRRWHPRNDRDPPHRWLRETVAASAKAATR